MTGNWIGRWSPPLCLIADNASSVKDTQDTAAQGGDGLNASLLLGALGLLGVLSLGAMVLMKNRSPSNPPVEVHSDTELPQERTSESKGLLARAKERQKPSQRNVSVLLWWGPFPLGFENVERPTKRSRLSLGSITSSSHPFRAAA